MPTLLIADRDPVVLDVLGRSLAAPGRTLLLAGSAAEARTLALSQGPVDVALLDRNLGDGSGLAVAAELKRRRPETEAILVTAYASFESAVEALQVGLYDYLTKPIDDFEALRLRIDNAFAKVQVVEERRTAEAGLRHLQKMDALGRMASGLGHDLANVLAVVRGWVDELELHVTGELPEGLYEIRKAADRAVRLVRQMMTLSRKGPAQVALVSANAALEELGGLLRRSLGTRVDLRLEPGPDLWPVLVDPSQLAQVFLNLAVNARDAMPEGGALTFRTENAPAAGRTKADGLPPGDCVLLTVTDEGVGMTEEVCERIFEPFFTTKPPGEGTGLGLAIVYGIVGQAGGTVQVRSAPGRGTTFSIGLPRAAEGAETATAAPRVAPAIAERSPAAGSVLVVHHDPQVRSVLARALRRDGFQVLEAGDAADALAVASAHHGVIEVLVASAAVRGASGPALAAALRRDRPALRAVLVGAFQSEPEVAAFTADGGEIVDEAFRPSDVVDAVRRAARQR